MRPSSDLDTPLRKSSLVQGVPKEKLFEAKKKEDQTKEKMNHPWGPTFKDKQHFIDMHFC